MKAVSELNPTVLRLIRGEGLSSQEIEIVKNWSQEAPLNDQLLKDLERGAPWIAKEIRKTSGMTTSNTWMKLLAKRAKR